MSLIIRKGTVYDPLNGVNGEKMDIFIEKGKVVEETKGKEIDASGLIVLPGGVDIHTHIAGSKVNIGRLLRPEDHRKDPVSKTKISRSGCGYSVPTTFTTGYRYAEMGYTTAMEAAAAPLTARHTHDELNDIPIIDKGGYILTGNNHFILKYIEEKDLEKLKNFIAWLLRTTKGYAVKIVNAGGIENWKWGGDVNSIDDKVKNYDVTPRDIMVNLAKANDELKLPHSVHVHTNKLGKLGNYENTIKTIEAIKDRIHITHIQYSSYAGDSWANFASGAVEVAKIIDKRTNMTCDMGQILFDDTTTMTADGPFQHRMYKISKNKWFNADVEMETGAGVVPYTYKKKNHVNAVQWAIGLEIALLIKDPWKICLTTDHPNGGPFYGYPMILSWLMNKKARDRVLKSIHPAASSKTSLGTLDKEFSLYEAAIITRATAAKALGLKRKGNLAVGSDADLAIYDIKEGDIEHAFSKSKYTIKGGKIVVKDGKVVQSTQGKTFWVNAGGEIPEDVKEAFPKYYTVTFENYPVLEKCLLRGEMIECG